MSPTDGQIFTYDATNSRWDAEDYPAGTGTVTAVRLATGAGSGLTISGSPITTDSTITLGLSSIPNTALANTTMTVAGQVSTLGGADTPISTRNLSDVDDVAPSDNNVLQWSASAGEWIPTALGTGGTVVSVDSGTGLTGGPITSSGTLAVDVGIADDKIVQIDSASVADNDYAKFTANGLEGRTASEVKTDLSLDNVENTALSTWAGSTNITTLGTVATGTWNATALGDSYISSAATWNAKQNALTFGIADTNSVVIDSASVADNDYAKFTSSGLEGRTASETKTDLSLDNVENTALSTWTGSTNVTTLGTIATGSWQGTAIDGTYIDLEGTEVKSAGPVTNDKYLRANGSGGATWETVPSGGDPAGTAVAMAIALGG